MNKYHSAGCIVLRPVGDSIQVLCLEFSYSDIKTGWVLPKGGIEEGESERDAAIRETKEETGLEDIEVLEKLGDFTFEFSDDPDVGSGIKTISWFLAISSSYRLGKVAHEEHEHESIKQIKWLDINFAKQNMLHDTDAQYIIQAEQIFNKAS